MKRLMITAAFLGFFAASGNLFAQEAEREAEKPAETEKPAEEPKVETKKGDKAAKFDRKSLQELGRVMRQIDADKDNRLSKEELGDDTLFDTLDKDKDGFLNLQEMAADRDAILASIEKQAAEAVKEEFAILDRDDSGKLSKEELGTDFGAMLESGDTDKDGQLNLEEFTAARKVAAAAKEDKPAKGERGDIMGKMDKDADGKISKDEAGAKLKEYFDELDTDKDGFLTAEELKAMAGKMGKKAAKGDKKAETPEKETPKKEEGTEPEKESEESMD